MTLCAGRRSRRRREKSRSQSCRPPSVGLTAKFYEFTKQVGFARRHGRPHDWFSGGSHLLARPGVPAPGCAFFWLRHAENLACDAEEGAPIYCGENEPGGPLKGFAELGRICDAGHWFALGSPLVVCPAVDPVQLPS